MRGLLLAALALLTLADPAPAAEPFVAGTNVDLDLGTGVEVPRRSARRLCRRLDSTFLAALDVLGLKPPAFSHSERLRPAWLTKVDEEAIRLRGVVEGNVLPMDPGLTAYLRRIRAGQVAVPLPSPADGWPPEESEHLRCEVAAAVVGNTLGDQAPLWLTYGLADLLAETLSKRPTATTRRHRADLARGDFALEWSMLLTMTDRADFESGRGRALAWAAVKLLEERSPRFLLALYHQIRRLARCAFIEPRPGAIRKEMTEVALDTAKRAGLDPKKLGALAVEWAKAEFPPGRTIATLPAARALGSLKTPRPYGVSLAGIVRRMNSDPANVMGTIYWGLPWPTEMRLWAGPGMRLDSVRLGTADPRASGEFVSHKLYQWSADPTGRDNLRILQQGSEYPVGLRIGSAHRVVLLLSALSPTGVGYFFTEEWRFR